MLVFDVVYNNAAMQHFGPMPDFSIDDWRATITGELDIPFFVSKFAWPHLVRRGGGVILNCRVRGRHDRRRDPPGSSGTSQRKLASSP